MVINQEQKQCLTTVSYGLKTLRERARQHIEQGAVTEGYAPIEIRWSRS